jgi:hypothetical protein
MKSPSSLLFLATICLPVVCLAQQPQVDNDFVHKQFGATCRVEEDATVSPADLDGDGIEDAVIVAHCKNPLIDEAEHNFKVLDPYNAYFGYSDPKVTSQFASEDPGSRGRVLLVIHGAGDAAWRANEPKAKFVIINLPFKEIGIKRLMLKKKPVAAIFAEESGGEHLNSALAWDGKKYRYKPLGVGLE